MQPHALWKNCVAFIIFSAVGFFLSSAVSLAQTFTTARPDGSPLHWILDIPDSAVKGVGLVVLMQGSGCTSADHNANLTHVRSVFSGFAALRVEKYGVNPGDGSEECSAEFYAKHSVSQRIADYLQIINALHSSDWWDGDLVLIGGSEGGSVAAALAEPSHADVVVLISTGGGVTFGQMVQDSIMDTMRRHSVPEAEWPAVDAAFAHARENPESSDTWAGSSYRYWADAIDRKPVDDMLKANSAFLLLHGSADSSSAVQSARMTADRFADAKRCNLTYVEFSSYDHSMIDADGTSRMSDVLELAHSWVGQQLSRESLAPCMQVPD
ncbi:alpha/beta hydrolase [Pseudovibrio japonicus]|uniref:Alpha/beta hydrolase n=1 Tax=Pseudovibrio japonicus TaxID=366534 RepID=A0ABQ3E1X8_9HYPH|nr:hypothetical protein [Pseudovibrio japonicus]GHB23103.1 alpha/beta hydrolase [Pseudovibrio japonicus]